MGRGRGREIKINFVSADSVKRILKEWLFFSVCVEVFWPCQPNGVMSSVVSLPNYMFTGQA